jgi:predicted DNA-binding ribbon-helix-helix protein
MKTKIIAVRVEEGFRKQLVAIAKQECRTISNLIQKILYEYVTKKDDGR